MSRKKDKQIFGSGGGGGGGGDAPPPPVIDPNNLQSNAIARIVDIIGQGEIVGLVDDERSIYVNETRLQDVAHNNNFEGITTTFKVGTPDQTWIADISASETETNVGVEVEYGSPISRTITDANVDSARVQIALPRMYYANPDNGDRLMTDVSISFFVNDVLAGTSNKHGKCVSEYRFSKRISNLSQYGSAPWVIKVVKNTEDGDNEVLANDVYFASYTEIIEQKFTYADTAVVGFIADAQQFGQQLPSRAYLVDGLKVKYPDNYDPISRSYSPSVWTGSFTTGWTDNPSWILWDLITNKKYGAGIDPDLVDKASFYAAAVYNDEAVDDGYGGTEPRFTFNYTIQQREEVYNILASVASSMMANLYWGTGKIYLVQDRPADPIKLVTNANVKNGFFDYQSTSESDDIYTSVNVSWNDPDNFYRPAIEATDAEPEDIITYGRKVLDLTEIGCTRRGQAYRKGKWALETSLNQKELVQYTCGFDHADVFPGDIIKLLDNNYANVQYGGRCVSGASSSVELDRDVTFDGVSDYYLSVETSGGNIVNDRLITNSGGTTSSVTISGSFDNPVQPNAVWIISAAIEPRLFRVISNTETAVNEYTIVALYHDPNKYDRVEDGKQFDDATYTSFPSAGILPPTDLVIREYEYEEGGLGNMNFGVELGWRNPNDPRIIRYNVQSKPLSAGWSDVGDTVNTYYDIHPVTSGGYYYRVRSQALTGVSQWLESEMFTVSAEASGTTDVTNLETINGPTTSTFDGPDCEFTWTYEPERGFKDYKVQIMTTSDVVLRTRYVTDNYFKYAFTDNEEDNSGTPVRSFKIKVWTRNQYNNLSLNGTALTVSNPAPTMSGTTPTVTDSFNGLKIDWSNITPNDSDLKSYKIYLDENNPPTTVVGEVSKNTTYWWEFELTPNTTYRVQIEPYDLWGVGTKSSIQTGEPLKISTDDIEGELSNRLTITDSASRVPSAVAVLYDRNTTTNGLIYNSGSWVDFAYPMQSLFDRVSVWANKTFNCYVSYKTGEEGDNSWYYLSGEADHSLDADGRLVTAPTSAAAVTNYWTANAGNQSINMGLFPNGLVANKMRLHILTASTTVYEIIFTDQVIAEWVVANQLSTISADLGTVAAGSLQSTDLSTDAGILIDLDNEDVKFGGTTDWRLRWYNGALTLKSDDGKTTFSGNSMIVKDASNVTRVVMGKLT
jgi:predicted phage tail protein